MTPPLPHPESQADRQADRWALLAFALFMVASFVIQATSIQIEARRVGLEPWLREGASHLTLLFLVPFFPRVLDVAPLSLRSWRGSLPVHLAACLAFSVLHVLSFVMVRKLIYPPVLGDTYTFGLADPLRWIYEIRKDAYGYVVVISMFTLARMAMQNRLEDRAADELATREHRLMLKSGGRTAMVNAGDVIHAKAAANYVEVITPVGTHLARMTLTELEQLLRDAGTRHARVHRSHIVNLDRVREISPTGEGDAVISLDTGETVPGSRRYRDRYMPAA
ncbi:MAG TPA: LytTR family DNA-binding domain-containing protein [Hyphomonas sp.]|nr:LytTR family transcriptional regulator [Hyphomonas sp.]MCB9972253.1 LytTR family transcriptional regulator [Hyphomonas sp.]HPE48469.1 LytTR family DNA-binding domain-containing protein [Hyphomonas sp.]